MRCHFVLPTLVVIATLAMEAAAIPQLPLLNWPGKRSDWINVKTDVTPAAIGNGIADDGPALQAAFSAISENSGAAKTVYLPAGTYRITQTLSITEHHNCYVVGHGRATVIKWDGVTSTTANMFWSNGSGYTLYEGIVWDGNNKAGRGIFHDSKSLFETEIDHRHMAFRNFTNAGIAVASANVVQASAEMSVDNCLFENCATGFSAPQWNDYDNLIKGCGFYNCGIGVSFSKGQGYIRDNHFAGSSVVDIDISNGPEHPCSIRRCTSVGSNKFLTWVGGVSTMNIQNCHISGWHNANGAISLSGPTPIVFDCVFTNPPNTNPPVNAYYQIISSNNASTATTRVYGPTTDIVEIPVGRLSGSVTSATQSFFKEQVSVPQKVYDVKALGATGNGSTNDYNAIKAAIDSARNHGSDAIAYFPRGIYRTNTTVAVTGANYRIGGSGFNSMISWGGAAGGTLVSVVDPRNVVVQQMAIGSGLANQSQSVDIMQTGTDASSTMLYDIISTYGTYAADPHTKGLQLSGLPSGAKVLGKHLQGNVRVTNSSRAQVLIDFIWEGGLTVEGATETVRDGFLGVLTRFNSNEPYGLYVKDNQSIVMTDYYSESADRYWSIEGNNSDIAGRVTVVGIKVQCALNPFINIQNYRGRISGLGLQHYQAPDTHKVAQTGTRPLQLLFMGNNGYDPVMSFSTTSSTTLTLIGNSWSGPANVTPTGGLQVASDALDDLRQLGALDMQLNFSNSSPVITGRSARSIALDGTRRTSRLMVSTGHTIRIPSHARSITAFDMRGRALVHLATSSAAQTQRAQAMVADMARNRAVVVQVVGVQ